jgi:hypothetical protein
MYGVWSEKRGLGEGFYVFAVYAVQESLEDTVTSAKSRPSRLKFPTSSESSRKLQEAPGSRGIIFAAGLFLPSWSS